MEATTVGTFEGKTFFDKVKQEIMDLKHRPPSHIVDEASREKWREEHAKLHERHKGHENMHAEMTLIFLVVMILAQVVLTQWKRRHVRSYQRATLILLWIAPLIISLRNGFVRFIFFWLIFSVCTGVVYRKSLERPLGRNTPRIVYLWFHLLYKISYNLGLAGYALIFSTLFGVNFLFEISVTVAVQSAFLFFFYSLYYGVLCRDIADMATDKIAASIGYYTVEGIPMRQLDDHVCAVCGEKVVIDLTEPGGTENSFKLTCGHLFHEFCIRGWCIVGKKQTCPYCKEKVDLRGMFRNPWEKPHVFYTQLLNAARWLMGWQPIILLLVSLINWLLGLE